jgi:DNA-binding MarR family transcriptional regulator
VKEQQEFEMAVTEFVQSIGLMVRRVRAAAANEELSWTEIAVLKRLAKEGAATTADLARAQGMKPQSMRTIVATLDELGMVERRPHATDGRQVNLELTAKGAAAEKSAGDARRTWLTQVIGQLDEREQETLFEAGRILRRVAEPEPMGRGQW